MIPMAATPRFTAVGEKSQGAPEFDCGGSELKVSRQHSDDRERRTFQDRRLPQDAGIRSISLLPGGIAEQNSLWSIQRILTRIEIAAEYRRHAEHSKEIVRDANARGRLRATRARQ